MRLLTHNQLICVVKGCEDNYPLKLTAKKVEQEESEFNPEFILGLLSHLNYQVLYNVACNDIDMKELTADLPAELPALHTLNTVDDEDLLKAIHTILLEIHVTEADLVCNKCERVYPIQDGIANMRLRADEV